MSSLMDVHVLQSYAVLCQPILITIHLLCALRLIHFTIENTYIIYIMQIEFDAYIVAITHMPPDDVRIILI